MKTFEISRGAPASTTFRKLTELFPDLNRNTDFEIVRGSGTNSLAPFATQPNRCSARDLNAIRGQGCLYLRLTASQRNTSTTTSTTTITTTTITQQSSSRGQQRSTNMTSTPTNPGRLWRQQLNDGLLTGTSSDEELAASVAGIEDQLSANEDMSSNGAANMGSGGGGTDAVTGGTGGDDGVDDASVDEIRDNSAGVTDNNDVAGDNSDQTEGAIHVTGEDSGTDAVGVANGSVNESGNNGAGSMVNNNVAGVNSDEADVVIDDGDNGDGSGALDTESDDDVVRINDADVVGHDDGPSNNADTGNDLSGDSVDANDSFGAGGSAGANDGDMHALDSGSDEDDIHVVQVKKVENNSTG
ncbi:uncharacterized protein [Porites lutea]|uniref:uncharacterized protein n=1 Tax=Porites lutea TaxID=51062 RepID=UPI003CC53B17